MSNPKATQFQREVFVKLRVLPLAITAVAVFALSCGDDDTTGTKDSTPPAAITNLTVTEISGTSVTLSWTAPGDDGTTGTATTYDIRYATSAIAEADWDSATAVDGEPAPQAAGTTQTMEVTLPASRARTTIEASVSAVDDVSYFAIKTADEADNWSSLSNVPNTESADLVAPAAITDLAIDAVSGTSATLSWTAPGDDGTTGTAMTYDIRYSTSAITDANWDLATSATGEPAPEAAGTSQSMVEIYSFTEIGDPDLLYEFPVEVNNLSGIVVAGGHAFVCLNAAGALYRVDVKTGLPVLMTDGLNFPQDIALLRD